MFRTGSLSAARRRITMATAVALLAAAGIAGGAAASTPPDGGGISTSPPAPAEGYDPDASVAIRFTLEPTSLDIIHTAGAAIDAVLIDNIYETLLKSTPDGAVSPGLAEVEISDDGLTYTLTLLEGITFSDGSPLTSADVVWSLDQLRTPGVGEDGSTPAAAGASAATLAQLASIDTVTAVDDSTVVLELSNPDNDLAWNLSRRPGVVLKEGATDLETTAVGTGPFTLVEWNQGSSITLARNDGYWGEPALVAEVVFDYITEQNAAIAALTSGDVDIATGVDTEQVSQFEDDPDFQVFSNPTTGEYTLGFNNADPALSDPLVRQAITQAIDKEGLLALYNGYGTIVGAPVPPQDPWYTDTTDIYPYDPDAARAKLEEAGYGDGLDLTFIAPNVYPQSGLDYVVSQLGDVGINVDLQTVEFSQWLEQVYTNKDFQLTIVLHIEPRDLGNYANPEYYWGYDSAEVQDLFAQAKAAATQEEYVELLRQATVIIATDAPTDVLLITNDLIVARTGVGGFPTYNTANRFAAAGIWVEG